MVTNIDQHKHEFTYCSDEAVDSYFGPDNRGTFANTVIGELLEISTELKAI
jgi:hypothetical protein